ncbi:hypothetical protein [Wocania ichthyoenteri]|uniref:hypothetical protein n=1 Tax=Wocania ichthyoenteri TaxID=1230531 RepID=UPI0012E0891B|nr:hypothetical protein [Wocania ichthyoenteri]
MNNTQHYFFMYKTIFSKYLQQDHDYHLNQDTYCLGTQMLPTYYHISSALFRKQPKGFGMEAYFIALILFIRLLSVNYISQNWLLVL